MYHPTIDRFRHAFGDLFPAILAVVCACSVSVVQAQQRSSTDTTGTRLVEILHADSSSGFIQDEHRVRSLTGNVRLKQDHTFLQADRVLQYLESDSIRFIGSVRIVDEGDTLRARRVLYDQRTRVGRARGDVVLTDGEVVLRAPSMRYHVAEKRAEFSEGARMRDSVSVLTSSLGTYWFEEKKAVLYRNVRLEQPETVLTSDSLVHYRERDRSIGFGNVVINHVERTEERASRDTTRQIILFGERAEHDNRREYREMTGDPFLVQLSYDSTRTDTLFVQADTIKAEETPDERRMQAVGDVRFWQRRLAAVADSVAYRRIDLGTDSDAASAQREEIRLYQEPIAWLERTQITGDTLEAAGANERIDSLWVYSRAFVASEDSATQRINQLKGESLRAGLSGNELQYVWAGPRGEALRFLTDDNNQPDGAVRVSADYIEGWFEDGSITRAKAVGGVEGTYYEEENIPESLQLDGLQWLPERRPTKETMLENTKYGEKFAPVTYRMLEDTCDSCSN